MKGLTVLFRHKPYNVVAGVAVDSLHCLYLGVVPSMMKMWFDREYQSCDYYIGNDSLLYLYMHVYVCVRLSCV